MTDEELSDALDGLYAYDTGGTDSGIHDEALRGRVKAELLADAKAASGSTLFGPRVTRLARELFVSDRAIEQGYGLEDLDNFVAWLDEL